MSAPISSGSNALYRTIWRWHFYAGLLVTPFVLILSVTGAIYLFKPQVERWEESAWQHLPAINTASPDAQRDTALAAFPGAKFHSYRLPQNEGDAALIHLGLPGGRMRDVFVSPEGRVVGSLDPERRIMQVVHDVHGELLLGSQGSWLVELAASWAIVIILSGLYLWWPAGRKLAGVVWLRLSNAKLFWRDLHAVTGFWVSALALVLLVTGLPWAGVWGSAFKAVRAELGWVRGAQDWTLGGKTTVDDSDPHAMHRGHDHVAMTTPSVLPVNHAAMDHSRHAMSPVLLSEIVARAEAEHLAFPVIVTPPVAAAGSRAKTAPSWVVRSDAQNRPLRATITYDAITGAVTSREGFADKHPIDRAVGYGIAWHEGQLFGWFNQLVGVLTAVMLVALAVSGFVMWRRRRPKDCLGAPPLPAVPARTGGAIVILVLLAALLPMLAISLVVLGLVERLILARVPVMSQWLGLGAAPRRSPSLP